MSIAKAWGVIEEKRRAARVACVGKFLMRDWELGFLL